MSNTKTIAVLYGGPLDGEVRYVRGNPRWLWFKSQSDCLFEKFPDARSQDGGRLHGYELRVRKGARQEFVYVGVKVFVEVSDG